MFFLEKKDQVHVPILSQKKKKKKKVHVPIKKEKKKKGTRPV